MNSERAREARDRIIVIADQADREAWLEGRRGGIGGSDVAALCGEGMYGKTAITVYDSIVHPEWTESQPENSDRLEMGQWLEPRIIGDLYIHGSPRWPRPGGAMTVWRPPSVAMKGREWQRGSADGLSIPSIDPAYITDWRAFDGFAPPGAAEWWDEIVEVKTHGYHGSQAYSKDPGADEPAPPSMIIQASWYGDLYSVKRASLAALMDTHLRFNWRWVINQDFVADLLTIAEDFWTKNILAGVEPTPDGSEAWGNHLKHKYRTSIGGTVVKASPELDEIVKQLKAAWLGKKDAEKRLETLSQIVKDAMGTHEKMDTHVGTISWANRAGKLSWRGAIDALYTALSWGAAQREEHESKHLGEPGRTFVVPHAKWKKS